MTKIALYSDLHLEFGDFERPAVEADVVILAGDTHTKARAFHGNAQEFFGAPVVAVMGNHEPYGSRIDTIYEKTKPAAESKGITLLECEETIVSGVRFLGCTLWTDFRLHAGENDARMKLDASICVGERYSGGMNDFHKIRVAAENYRKFRPLDAAKIHMASVKWLDNKLGEAFDGPTIVVTHHAPSAKCVPEHLMSDRRTCAYASNLDWLIEKHQPDAWFWGHIHENVDSFYIGKTLMASNPRGYYPNYLNPKFKTDLVFEFETSPTYQFKS